jgi:hypothetical protein
MTLGRLKESDINQDAGDAGKVNISDTTGIYKANYSNVDRGDNPERGTLTLVLEINGNATFTYNRIFEPKNTSSNRGFMDIEPLGCGSWTMRDNNTITLKIDKGYTIIGTYR